MTKRYTPKISAPPEGYVPTREAAMLWGCHPNQLRRWMREAGIAPVRGSHDRAKQGTSFYWDPAEVLAVRAILKKRPQHGPRLPITKKDQRDAEAKDRQYKALAKRGQMAWLRQYYLDKAKRKREEP